MPYHYMTSACADVEGIVMSTCDPGVHAARARCWRFKLSSNDNWFLWIEFVIVSGKSEGAAVHGMLHFTKDNLVDRSYRAMRAMGWGGTDAAECNDNGCGLDGNEVRVLVEHEDFNGKTYAKVTSIDPPENAIDVAALRKFLLDRKAPPPAKPPASTPALQPSPAMAPSGSGNVD